MRRFRTITAALASVVVIMVTVTACEDFTASGANCVDNPSACGYPDATNTGVPAGTDLLRVPEEATSGLGWQWDARGWLSVYKDGTILDGIETNNIDVSASNVTIKNSLISVDTSGNTADWHSTAGIKVYWDHDNVLIRDTEIHGSGLGKDRLDVGVKCYIRTCVVLRTDIWGATAGVQADAGIVADSYIHDFGWYNWGGSIGQDHNVGISTNATGGLAVRHNTILNQLDQTAAVAIYQDFGPQANNLVFDNLLGGGGYVIYGGGGGQGGQTRDIRIFNNRISRKFWPNGGQFGVLAVFDPNGPGNEFTGNVWDENDQLIG